MKHLRTLGLLAVLSTAATASGAQGFDVTRTGVEGGVSTLGFFVAPDYGVTDSFRVRAPLYFGRFSQTFEDDDDNDIDASVDVTALHLMADYYVGGSAFRISGGLGIGG
jgi:hypothetical protein